MPTTRESRAARTSGLRITTSGPSVRTTNPQREVPDATPAAEARVQLAQQFTNFFQPAIQQFQQNEQTRSVDEIRRENVELATRARLDATNPDAIAAARSGNISGFAGDEVGTRRAYAETLKDTIAKRMAAEDFSTKFHPALTALDFDQGDPAELKRTFLEENLEGADPLFMDSYQQAFDRNADQAVFAWRQQRATFQSKKIIQNTITTMQADPPTSAPAVQQFLADIQNSALGAEGKIAAHQDGVTALFREAAKSPAVLRALTLPDPGHPAQLSLKDQNPELWKQAQQEAIAEFRAVNSLAAQKDLSQLDERVTLAENGQGEFTLGELYGQTVDHLHKYGDSTQRDDMRDRIVRAIGNNAEFAGGYRTLTQSDGFIPDSWLNKHGMRAFQEYGQQLAAEGKTPQQITGRLAGVLARRGFGDDFNDNLAHELNSDDPARVQEAFVLLSAAEANRPGIAAVLGLDEETQNMFSFMQLGRMFSDPDSPTGGFAFGTTLEEYRNIPKEARNFERWAPKTFGDKPFNEALASALDELDESEYTQEVTIQMRREMARTLARLWRDDASDPAELLENAAEIAVHSVSKRTAVIEVDGDRMVDIDNGPRRILLPNGETVHARSLNGDDIDFIEDTYDDLRGSVGDALGSGFAGVRPDRLGTPSGRGYEFLVYDTAGTPVPLVGSAGAAYDLEDAELTGEEVISDLVDRGPDGQAVLSVPQIIPDEGIPLTANGSLRMYPHPTNPGMFKVYATGDRTSIEAQIASENLRRQEIIAGREGVDVGPNVAAQSQERQRQLNISGAAMGRKLMGIDELLDKGAVSGQGVPRTSKRAPRDMLQAPGNPDTEDLIPDMQDNPKAHTREFDKLLDELSKSGRVPASTKFGHSIDSPEDLTAIANQVGELMADAALDGYNGDSIETSFDQQFSPELLAHIEIEEGFSPVVYPDGNDLSIGLGFHLARTDARKSLEALGYDWEKVRAGKQSIQRKHAVALATRVLNEHQTRLTEEMPGLRRHQLLAMLDLAYNCPECAFGKKIQAAWKAGDVRRVAWEIAYNSNRGNNPVIAGRRIREADKFLGANAAPVRPDEFQS